ncbi:MAG: CBS domain-containing protein [Saprospiraceae bacterium]|nr:CBS domain-containing protein [Saprospiraceae bacterium]
MIAEQLISNEIIPLRTSDTGDEALSMMSEFYVRHLPIVNNRELLGLISEDDILNFDANEAVGSYSLSLTHPYVKASDHLYEIMRVLSEYQLTLVPVVDEQNNYIGVVIQEYILHYFASTTSFKEPGSIIVLEVHRHDYSLAEIARIVESENAIVTSVILNTESDTPIMEVTIKVNTQNIGAILSTLERFNYQIRASFNESEFSDTFKERYDSFMAYLNV